MRTTAKGVMHHSMGEGNAEPGIISDPVVKARQGGHQEIKRHG